MINQIKYARMKSGEESQVIEIVLSTFSEFVAPQFSNEGIAEFQKYAKSLAERNNSNHFTIIAKQDNNPIGVIEIRNNSHIALFFIRKNYQNMGIGKKILKHAINICLKECPELEYMTVNSSPNSVKAYEKMGFKAVNSKQCINGILFIPMTMNFNKNTGK